MICPLYILQHLPKWILYNIPFPPFFHFSNITVYFVWKTPNLKKYPSIFTINSFYSTPLIFKGITNVIWMKLPPPPSFLCNEHIQHETVFSCLTCSCGLFMTFFVKTCISNIFISINICSSWQSYSSQYLGFILHYCFFFTPISVFMRAFYDMFLLKPAFQIYLPRTIFALHYAVILPNIWSTYMIFFYPYKRVHEGFFDFLR